MKLIFTVALASVLSITAFGQNLKSNQTSQSLNKYSSTINTGKLNSKTNLSKTSGNNSPVSLKGAHPVSANHAVNFNTTVNNVSNPFAQTQNTNTPSLTLGNNDTRNLPLNANGKLLSVDGYEVNFEVPKNKDVSNICYTPVPVMNNAKDPACGFNVPCDNPANRDAVNTTTIDYYQLVWHVFWDGGAPSNIDQTRLND